ncbi:MAG: hypothetical protein ABIE07_00575 [Candidatus Zixiibacteriota bacterium]
MRSSLIKILVVTIIAYGVMAGQCFSQSSKHVYPLDFKLEPITKPLTVGPAQLKFTFTHFWMNETMTITVDVINGLEYHGENPFTFECKIEEELEFILDITLPPNDTSAIDLSIDGTKGHWNATDLWFVTTGDTVEMYLGKPVKQIPARAFDRLADSTKRRLEREYYERQRKDSLKEANPDSIGVSYIKSSRKPTKREQLEFAERKPLVSKFKLILMAGKV